MKRILAGLADLIFPPRCIACEKILIDEEHHSFCCDCYDRIGFVRSPVCTQCGIPFAGKEQEDHPCGECLTGKPVFTAARCVGRYEEPLLSCIHQFKYNANIGAGRRLGKLMAQYEYPAFRISDYSLIIPIPLHLKRLRERGFNQSLILAKEIAKQHHLPVDFMNLKRQVYTKPQVNLGKDERQANVRGAFKAVDAGRINGEKIILVDDVYTTGSTVRECATVLMKAGAQDVAVLTLARAV
ncbi:MAG: ComF family protein [Deltaproteobacteria bacterium]|nr:ComF family protein [Deltaproteobacteria bacterium]